MVIEEIHTVLVSGKRVRIRRKVLPQGDADNFGENALLTLKPHNSEPLEQIRPKFTFHRTYSFPQILKIA